MTQQSARTSLQATSAVAVEMSSSLDQGSSSLRNWITLLRAIWLFTRSDIKTIWIPSTVFGVANAAAANLFGQLVDLDHSRPLQRLPLVIFWVWINLLPFNIDNQRRADSVAEDAFNKPWRPLPLGLLTPRQAHNLMHGLYVLALLSTFRLGGSFQCLALMFFGWWYNSAGGSDNLLVRNFINACGFVCFASGAMEVSLGQALQVHWRLMTWLAIIAAIVFTSVQSQDMYDQEGDKARGRQTLPLMIGDMPARWSIAVAVQFWSLACPWYWALPVQGYLIFLPLGSVIGTRSLVLRSPAQDRLTFKLWTVWMTLNYLLPLGKMLCT